MDRRQAPTDRELDLILENDREWRKRLWHKMEAIEKDQQDMLVTMTTLKVKFGMISGIFGAVAGFFASKI